jgi:antirestriction protein
MKGEQQPEQQDTHDGPSEPQPAIITPRIYVASLPDYNAGRLHGAWLDAAQEPEELHDQIAVMLAASHEPHAEEWAIHDFEGFNGLHLGEWEDLAHVSRVAKGITEHGLAFAHWTTLVATDEDLDQFDDAYLGHWPSLTGYAEDVLDDLGLDDEVDRCVPENLRPYVTIDAEAFGRDLELGGDVTAIEDGEGVHVFANRW